MKSSQTQTSAGNMIGVVRNASKKMNKEVVVAHSVTSLVECSVNNKNRLDPAWVWKSQCLLRNSIPAPTSNFNITVTSFALIAEVVVLTMKRMWILASIAKVKVQWSNVNRLHQEWFSNSSSSVTSAQVRVRLRPVLATYAKATPWQTAWIA